MTKYFLISALTFVAFACNQHPGNKELTGTSQKNSTTRFYSQSVKDSFSIFINLPEGYNTEQKKKYPVVYLLDANFFFDIMAAMLNKYSEVGMQPVILVGIGYKDFTTMDSLRDRDYTFPAALPKYEMHVSGGADKFLAFLQKELMPHIESTYRTDSSQRILMGHSLGGYFTEYALYKSLLDNRAYFNAFIAGSPSFNYNNYYLLNQLEKLSIQKDSTRFKTYITFGGLEDTEDPEDAKDSTLMKTNDLMSSLSKLAEEKLKDKIIFKSDFYSNLGHMDTPFPTFTKGLFWVLPD